METLKLTIPNMKSPHCMMVVSGTIKNLDGATLKNISSASVEIELSGATKSTVVKAIERAGYLVISK
jgi:copper chaperone CopZ